VVKAEAILLIREPNPDYYDEGEVVVDLFKFGKMKQVERLTAKMTVRRASAGAVPCRIHVAGNCRHSL
jgi:hypothetical protein